MFSGKKQKQTAKEEIYPVRAGDRLREGAVYLVFVLILYLFFKSVFALLLLIPMIAVCHRIFRREWKEKYQAELCSQFKDALLSVSAALRAGYSMENALPESAKEMELMYGSDALIARQLQRMKHQLSIGMPLEDIFEEFAEQSGVRDIETFSEVFQIARKSGGDLVEIIRKTADDIAAKTDTRNEIAVVVRAKRLEQNIMTLMPPFIILYVDLTSGSLLDPLYQTLTGRLIMLGCLILYAGAVLLGRKVTKIEI